MARNDPQFNLRITQELKDRLEIEAKKSGRSITQEIIKRLEKSLESEVDPKELFNYDDPRDIVQNESELRELFNYGDPEYQVKDDIELAIKQINIAMETLKKWGKPHR